MKLTKIVEREIQGTKSIALETYTGVHHILSTQKNGHLHQWLSPPDPSTNYRKARALRHDVSGLTDHELHSQAVGLCGRWRRPRNSTRAIISTGIHVMRLMTSGMP